MRAATPTGEDGGVVLFHDGGGNRRQTLAALERMIPMLLERGYRFTTLSESIGLEREDVNVAAGTWERVQGAAFMGAMRVADAIAWFLKVVPIPVTVLLVLRAFVLFWLARRHARDRARRRPQPPYSPPVSIVVPAYNEEVGIEGAVRSLLDSEYASFEVIVVDDGSTDRTAAILGQIDDDRLVVVHQRNAGKAAALNAGIPRARHDVLVMVDGDTQFAPQTLARLVRPLVDESVGAVSGNTKIGNRKGIIGNWQHIEYVMGFNLDRRAFEVLDCMPTVPGAVGAFRRRALDDVGLVSEATIAEDTDLTLAINRAGWRIVYEDSAVAWTEAPATLGALWRQRYRWCYGTLQSIWKHRSALWQRNDRRRAGRAIFYLTVFTVLTPLLSPAIDLFAIYGIVFLNPVTVLVYWMLFNLLQIGICLYAFRLDRERFRPILYLPLQQFVYRQLMYLVIYHSVMSAIRGVQLRWHKLARTGDVEVPTGAR